MEPDQIERGMTRILSTEPQGENGGGKPQTEIAMFNTAATGDTFRRA